MNSFWLTKEMILEALKLSEGAPQNAFVCFHGKSEVKKGKEYTIMEIVYGNKKKTVKQEFKKIAL